MHIHKILVADDEIEARKLLLMYLDQYPLKKMIIEAADGKETLLSLQEELPDILFLDMKMPGLTGIEVLGFREKTPLPAIIFTTAFDEFALPAFDYDAVDYLLKPFDQQRFVQAMNKAMEYVKWSKLNLTKSKLQALSIKNGAKSIILEFEDIEYFFADGPYIRVTSNQKRYMLSMPMYELQHSLPSGTFLRIHRSCIVNIKMVKEIRSLMNGDYTLLLLSGKELRASRTYREQLRAIFGKI